MKHTREAWVNAVLASRPREKTASFAQLLEVVNDLSMAEIIWVYYGEGWNKALDDPASALNSGSNFWRFFKKRNTIRSLLKDNIGREKVWKLLEDAGAWLL